MMPLRPLLKNKLLLQKHYHINEFCIDEWPFWMLEENIKIVNELNDEEDKNRKQEEESQQKSMPNFNPNSMMSNIGNMTNNLGNFKP
jgi:hypothetical protein